MSKRSKLSMALRRVENLFFETKYHLKKAERNEIMQTTLHLTQAAAEQLHNLISEEGNLNLKLRIYVQGGGCSGFQYGFSFEETVNEDDTLIEHEKPKVGVLVDELSLPYLQNAEIDYVSDIQGEQFIIRNPQAKTTCGCGSSFNV